MGKIIKLKNKKTGEHVYPVSVTKAIADPDTGERLNDILQNKVEEAPMDGKQYARINKSWAQIEGGSISETALISVTPNINDLLGVQVKVTANNGDVLLDTTWDGAQLSVQIQDGLEYTVTVGDKEGFITPAAVTYKAFKGATRSINMTYIESKLKVNILSNQEDDSVINNVKAIVKYGETSVQVNNGDIIALPLNVAVSITFPDVAGYKKPETISYTHTSGSYEKSGTYQTEIVSVTLSADNGKSVNGQIVTINGTQHTWNGTAITQKVAFGVNYSVSVNDKSGYIKPSIKDFTANQKNRNLSFIYKEIPLGVYIQGVSGEIYTKNEWTNQETPNGILVSTNKKKFVIALQDASDSVYWKDNVGVDPVPGLAEITSESKAKTDLDGESNTNILLTEYSNRVELVPAAYYAGNFTFPNGEKGYLGSAGEWQIIADNKSAIVDCYRVVGEQMEARYWTSTQRSGVSAWILEVFSDPWVLTTDGVGYPKNVRAFTSI